MEVKEVMKLGNPWKSDARLYMLDEEVESQPLHDGTPVMMDHIIVSAVKDDEVTQTYIFPSNALGFPIDFVHLKGSLDGELDHDKAVGRFIASYMSGTYN